ncbi:MAG: hypothetical protein ACRD2W_21765 [Acidimicrobiales bacterium]
MVRQGPRHPHIRTVQEVPMEPDSSNDVAETKDDEILEREGVEQELMQQDASEVGEELDDVQDAATGE